MYLKTKRLLIIPLNLNELDAYAEEQSDAHLKSAYHRMKKTASENENKFYFCTLWHIKLKDSEEIIGDIAFMGEPDENKSVEIGYGINGPFRNKGYAKEALKAMCDWAFLQKGVYFVRAFTEEGNSESAAVLSDCGFVCAESGEKELLWRLEKPNSSWFSVFMCLGISVGAILGSLIKSLGTFIALGMLIGICVGGFLDFNDRKARRKSK